MSERRRRVALLVLLGVVLAGAPAPSRAQTSDRTTSDAASPVDPFAGLTSPHFEAIAAAVGRLGAEGAPQAQAVLRALSAHHLFVAEDGGLYVREGESWTDARTGAPVASAPAGARMVRENNRVRGALAQAMAGQALLGGDAAARRDAAVRLADHPDPAMLPVVERALATPHEAGLDVPLQRARAAMLLSPGAPTTGEQAQSAAVRVLRDAGGLDARAVLARFAADEAAPAEARKAARRAIVTIDRRIRLWNLGQQVFYGLSLGSVLLLAAMGLAITFGVMGIINMAHGELVMLGAYTTYLTQKTLTAVAPGLAAFSLPLAVPVAFLVCGAAGMLIERGLIRFLYGRPLETLLATWGLSLVLQQAVRSLFGPTNVAVATPGWLAGSFQLGGLTITLDRFAIMLFAGAVMGAVLLVLRRTALGLQMRAVTQNRRMAALMGIRTARVDALTFGLGSGVAGLAGVAVSQIDNVSPNLGQGYIIDSFLVVVFGGVGNLWGTLAAAMTLGVGGKALEPLVGAVSGKILLLLLVILFIQRHPRGMFPLRGRGVES
ncbi:urea ABC transporter permease subunit UrtB [Gluconacetobacter azotocaptans]|uniref:Urea ABC transporter permease subunit UrtB n=2 Tax=Gluconacetobacter azotocaptans TaxID=142834 RepID=A0A7W4PEK9_9PROT|nr:urea ABC transporter permease subunit UrtB [Gluconacetobacter azotocaptans]MBB2191457.1 urea ABC transporter permease subunit UrtB [Gluconacetobacter azotocaptans]MBM9403396.1 urea ABC transporter permease subunit UrtB [Gluconacetobacter azotocaptans]